MEEKINKQEATNKKQEVVKNKNGKIKNHKTKQRNPFPRKLISLIAEEVAKTVIRTLPKRNPNKKKKKKKAKRIENAVFFDTSAIIDGRIFEVIKLGIFYRHNFLLLESILGELKHIADSKDLVKRERGRRGLEGLEALKKNKGIRITIVSEDQERDLGLDKIAEVDERLIRACKINKAQVLTCDYNLEKKASINGVLAININTLANILKITAVPGESLYLKILHRGKDVTQGVGYLDDGTMVVVENAANEVGHEVNVAISRVIQTTGGRILFAKSI
jgi:uncharacterized protein YacL